MSKESGQFVFMTCRAGAESALKQEIVRTQPGWRLAFSRPGFLTFKQAEGTPLRDKELAERSWTFAHAHGNSLGRLTGSQLANLVEQFWSHAGVVRLAASKQPLDIHVWQREPMKDDAGEETFVTPLCLEIEAALRAAAPESAQIERTMAMPRRPSPRHSAVLDVVVVEPVEWWIGYHWAVRRSERWPGGAIPLRLPKHAVSRAYSKLQEAIQWSDLPLAAEDECVEIGCAPGGASQALLDRGLFVTGIDPADVDPAVLEHPRFRHLKKRGTEVRRQEFVGVRWLAADMNIAPDDALAEVEAIVTSPQVSIRGLVLTLKLSDWSIANRLPEFVERVRSWGYRDVRTRQLVTGGQEVCLIALRRKALRRLGGKHSRRKKPQPHMQSRVDEAHTTPSEPHF
jgi:23S rRNA (cytidine2498-2'-O)-methyltransferase